MDTIPFILIIVELIIIILLCVNTFKEQIITFQMGIRRKTALFMDIRTTERVTLSPDLRSFEYRNYTYVWNTEREKNNGCVYILNNAEALNVTLDAEKCLYWCDTNEYHTNLKNKLLETLMMLKARDAIIAMLAFCLILTVVAIVLIYFRTGSILEATNTIQSGINALNQTTNNGAVVVSKV